MLAIDKRSEPRELLEYRLQADAVYDGPHFTSVKSIIRHQLLDEQGHLCAYCMGRIKPETMKVEHWLPQKGHTEMQLAYANLLGVCKGNEGQAPANQHCDTHKGNLLISYNPANPAHRIEDKIQYLGNGTIKASEAAFDKDLDKTLNLNESRLRANRKEVVEAVRRALAGKPGTRTKAQIEKYLHKWQFPAKTSERPAYAGVAIYWLTKYAKRR